MKNPLQKSGKYGKIKNKERFWEDGCDEENCSSFNRGFTDAFGGFVQLQYGNNVAAAGSYHKGRHDVSDCVGLYKGASGLYNGVSDLYGGYEGAAGLYNGVSDFFGAYEGTAGLYNGAPGFAGEYYVTD